MSFPCVSSWSSVAEAIDILQHDSDRGVIVVDAEDRVVGILTEGDIVRAIRRGVLSESLVSQVITGTVMVAMSDLSDEELAIEFINCGTLLVPVVDTDRRLVHVQRTRPAVQRLLGIAQLEPTRERFGER